MQSNWNPIVLLIFESLATTLQLMWILNVLIIRKIFSNFAFVFPNSYHEIILNLLLSIESYECHNYGNWRTCMSEKDSQYCWQTKLNLNLENLSIWWNIFWIHNFFISRIVENYITQFFFCSNLNNEWKDQIYLKPKK